MNKKIQPNDNLPESAANCVSLPQLLQFAATRHPERGISILDRRGQHADRRTYGELLALASAGAARWKKLGVQAGDRVLICLPNSWNWMEAWFGALLNGSLPVALASTGAMSVSDAFLRKFDGVAERLDARSLVCDASLCQQAAQSDAQKIKTIALSTESFAAISITSPLGPPPGIDPARIAFLQLTSGSTGVPRAVMISHQAALHNPGAIAEAIGAPYGEPDVRTSSSVVSWLPLNHDMGLVGCLLFSIYNGLDLCLMRPDSFLLRPLSWLKQLSRNGVCLAPAPNFAYQSCVERLKDQDLTELDLSGWRAAMTGAEMVRPETCEAFNNAFAAVGFNPRSFRPCFGLAEGTLAVTFDRKGLGYRTEVAPRHVDAGLGLERLVCTGSAVKDTVVRITAPNGDVLPEGCVGQVEASGPGIFSGYHNDPEATRQSLKEGWLITGDLGFMRNSELYLTGRSKEILILHGHNVMPHEIEWVAESVTGSGGVERSGAFSVAKNQEGEVAVLVIESGERDLEKQKQLVQNIKLRIADEMGLPLADVVLVRRGQIPKTTSGKVQRNELRQRYLNNQIEGL